LAAILVVFIPRGETTEPSVAIAAIPGRIAFGHKGDIWMSEDGSTSPVTQGGRYWGHPDWAPDGSAMAIVGWGPNSSDIFVLSGDRSELRQLTRGQSSRLQANEWTFHPQWSPDGQSIAYLSDRTSQYTMLWIMSSSGTNQRQLTRPRGALDTYDRFAWSPDGSQIAITGFASGRSQIYLVSLSRPDVPRAITSEPGGAFDPAWSPDGRYLAFAAREGRRVAIRVVDIEAGDPPSTLVNADMARSPRWAPWGGAIAYIGLAGSDFELFVANLTNDGEGHLSAGRPSQITNRFGLDATSGLSWTP
jgi:TolB protein